MKEIKEVKLVMVWYNKVDKNFVCCLREHNDIMFETIGQVKNWIESLDYPVYIEFEKYTGEDDIASLYDWFDEHNRQVYIDHRLSDEIDSIITGTKYEKMFKKYLSMDIEDITPYTVFKINEEDIDWVPYEYYLQNLKVYNRLRTVLYKMTLRFKDGYIKCVIGNDEDTYYCDLFPAVDNASMMVDILNEWIGRPIVLKFNYYDLDMTTIMEYINENLPFITTTARDFAVFSNESFEEYTVEDFVFHGLVSNGSMGLDKKDPVEFISGREVFIAYLVESILTPIQKKLKEKTIKYLNND